MWVAVVLSMVAGGAPVASASVEEQPLRWVRSLDEGKKLAVAEHKDLFVNFTGLEWCGNCIDLDTEVLSRAEFRAAADDFVLVDLDFPGDREQLGALQGPYDAWTKQYLIHGFPTVVLTDEAGRPYAYFTGYDEEVDAARFMSQLAAARKAHRLRDQELGAAKQATGAARARKLHAAIDAVAAALGSLEECADDPVLTFYHHEVDEIRRLDADNALGLKAIYDVRTRARDEDRRRAAILYGLSQFPTKEDSPAVLAYIDKQLKETIDTRLRFALERRRYSRLEWMEQHAEALEALRRLLKDPSCPADDRNWMLRNEALLLWRLGRLDEALAFYDEQIAAAKDGRSCAYFLNWKANMLFGTGRHEEILATCRALQAAEKPKAGGWAEATFYLAWSLQKAGRHDEAIGVYETLLAYDRQIGRSSASHLLLMAESHHALGHVEEERRALDEVEMAIATQDDRPAKQKEMSRLCEELHKARKRSLEKSSK